MAGNFIPGIYNYCDRWCERCTFSSRCRNYEGTAQLSPEEHDVNNEAFWNGISASLEKAIGLLHEVAHQRGHDLSAIPDEEIKQYSEMMKDRERIVGVHPLSLLSKKYQQTVTPFLKKELNEQLVDTVRQMTSRLHMGMNTEEELVYTMAKLGNCYDVIQWYCYFIGTKIHRALSGKMEDQDEEHLQSDSNGSAKIAIIAIERSMGAWENWLEGIPSSEDIALQALAVLSSIRRQVLEAFPDAMQFKRPGFDD